MNEGIMLAGIIGPVYLVLGFSMSLQNRPWVRRVKALVNEDAERVMFSVFELILGLVVVLKYNLWDLSPLLIVTITGWLMIIEAVMHLLVPEKIIRKMIKDWNHAAYFKTGGIVMILLGLWLCYFVYLAG